DGDRPGVRRRAGTACGGRRAQRAVSVREREEAQALLRRARRGVRRTGPRAPMPRASHRRAIVLASARSDRPRSLAMQSKAATVAEYLAELPEDQRAVMQTLVDLIRKHLPKGYAESMQYGM